MNCIRVEAYIKIKELLDLLQSSVEKIFFLEEKDYSDYSKSKKLIKYIEDEINKNKDSIEELKNPFLLFVVGSGNYGKSTLINALLKDNIIETTDIPNTWKVDMYCLGYDNNIEIVYSNTEKRIYKKSKGRKILSQEEELHNKSKKNVSKVIREHKKKNIYTKEQLIELKSSFEKELIYKSQVTQVRYYLKNIDILRDFVIVDTPGINQNLLKQTKDVMKDYYNKADGILWLIDAQNIVSKGSKSVINEINDINKRYGSNKNMIGVINKMDIIGINNEQNIENVKVKAIEIYKNYFKDIVFISAKMATEGVNSKDKSKVEKSNINSLHNSINENLKITSQEKQVKSKYINIQIMKDNILREIEVYKRQLYNDISILNENEYEFKSKIESLKSHMLTKISELNQNNYFRRNDYFVDLIEDISHIESMCNKSLNKIYESLVRTSNNRYKNIEHYNVLSINFTKIKKSIYNLGMSKVNPTHNYMHSTNLYTTKVLETISREFNNSFDESIDDISRELKISKEENFRNMYFSYDKYKEFISVINNIEEILIKWGE